MPWSPTLASRSRREAWWRWTPVKSPEKQIQKSKKQNTKLSNFLDADSNKEENKKIKVSFYILTTCDTNPSRDPKVLFSFWKELLKDQGFDVTNKPRVQQTENTKNSCEQAKY